MTITVKTDLDNAIIGGDFHVNPWQRGTTFVSPVSGDYTADKFRYRFSGAQDVTITKDISAPPHSDSGLFLMESHRTDVTTANVTPGVADFSVIEQPIEGYRSLALLNNRLYLSFWAFSTLAGTYCFSLQNNSRSVSYIQEYTISTPNTFEQFEFIIEQDATTAVWETEDLTGMNVIFTLSAGTSFQTTPDAWNLGNFLATSNQTNLMASTANDFRVALVLLSNRNPGSIYPGRGRATELLLAQRYYEKSYNIDVAPGTVTDVGQDACRQNSDNEIRSLMDTFRTPKRATPTITWYSPDTGASGNIFRSNVGADHAVTSTNGAGQRSTGWPGLGSSVGTDWEAHWTADSDL